MAAQVWLVTECKPASEDGAENPEKLNFAVSMAESRRTS